MKQTTLARAIERDLLRTEKPKTEAPRCHACGRSFMRMTGYARSTALRAVVSRPNPEGDDNTWAFCSARCREAYDNGWAAYDPHYANKSNPRWYSLPMGKYGFLIECLGCGKDFDSKGLRCCSVECERDYRKRLEAEAVMAEVGMDALVKRKCEQCGGDIPNWRNGRRVRSNYCSKSCQQKASKAARMARCITGAGSARKQGSRTRMKWAFLLGCWSPYVLREGTPV
jgi:hypothetical protein